MERRIEGVKMKASLKKRMNAYLIDLIILLIVLSLIGFLYTPNNVSLNNDHYLKKHYLVYIGNQLSLKQLII